MHRIYRLTRSRPLLSLLLFLPLSTSAFAQVFQTHGVQYPVWITHGDVRMAIGPGAAVMAGDVLTTGEGGKAWLIMPDGAMVKLGENASLRANDITVTGADQQPGTDVAPGTNAGAEAGVIEASFDVLEGAFRYTTEKLNSIWQRDVRIGLGGTATIGIRGTDLWGRVDSADTFVVLLEGIIGVTPRAGGERRSLKDPLSVYTAASQQVSSVDMAAVQALAPETELEFGNGVQVEAGAFVVHLASYGSQSAARAANARLGAAGLSADVASVTREGRTWYRLTVAGLNSLGDARALAERARGAFDFDSPWVANRSPEI